MPRPAPVLAALAAAAGGALPAPAAAAPEHRSHARVAIADGATGRVSLHSLRDGRRIARFALGEAPTALHTAPDGRHVLAIEQRAGRVSAIDGGAWVVDHGDHQHVYAGKPRKLRFAVRATKPSHVVGHGSAIAVFDDGTGRATRFDVAALRDPAAPLRTLATPAPHHGVAVPLDGDRTLVSLPNAAKPDELPIGVALLGPDGAERQRFADCPDLHGELSDGRGSAFGCADGVLLIEEAGGGAVRARKVPTPAGSDHVTRLLGAHDARRVVGSFGERALALIDRRSARARIVRFPAAVEDFAVDPHNGATYVLTTDGRVRRLGRSASRRVLPRFRSPADWRDPRPELAAADGELLVADPRRGRVLQLDGRTLGRERALRTGGRPFHLAITGIG